MTPIKDSRLQGQLLAAASAYVTLQKLLNRSSSEAEFDTLYAARNAVGFDIQRLWTNRTQEFGITVFHEDNLIHIACMIIFMADGYLPDLS